MIPSATSVVRARYWTSACVRALALLWLVYGLRALPEQFFSMFLNVTPASPFGPAASGGVGFVLPSVGNGLVFFVKDLAAACCIPVLLVLFEKRLVRWVIPTPPSTRSCPECGYALTNLASPICPECGTNLRTPTPTPTPTSTLTPASSAPAPSSSAHDHTRR